MRGAGEGKAGDGASLAVAGGGEFLAPADRAEVPVRCGTSSAAVGGQTFLVAGDGEPLAVIARRLIVSQGLTTPGLARFLVASGGEPWSDGGGASESGGASEL
jgi:hypothetical protein